MRNVPDTPSSRQWNIIHLEKPMQREVSATSCSRDQIDTIMGCGGFMKVIRQDKDIHESVMDEYARYLAMKNQADLAYVAMMNGIELEEENEQRFQQD